MISKMNFYEETHCFIIIFPKLDFSTKHRHIYVLGNISEKLHLHIKLVILDKSLFLYERNWTEKK